MILDNTKYCSKCWHQARKDIKKGSSICGCFFQAPPTIARDGRGDVLKIWAKTFGKSSPILAKAHAILWGVQLAREEGWNRIILEGDAKSCFDPLTTENISPARTISNVINNVLCLKHLFSVCHFCWVKRDSNAAEHAAAKLSFSSLESFYFSKDNFPRALASICKAECPSFSVFERNCSLSQKRKWRVSVNSLFYFCLIS